MAEREHLIKFVFLLLPDNVHERNVGHVNVKTVLQMLYLSVPSKIIRTKEKDYKPSYKQPFLFSSSCESGEDVDSTERNHNPDRREQFQRHRSQDRATMAINASTFR